MMPLDACDSGFHYAENEAVPHPRPRSDDAARARLVVALDKPTVAEARQLVEQLGELVEIYKVGLELALSEDGLEFARELHRKFQKKIFLDMKFLDIPNTVHKAVANVARMGFEFLTVHAHDTKTMIAAVAGRDSVDPNKRLKLLGVTVLTSCDWNDLKEQGLHEGSLDLAVRRSLLACSAGFDGVIASGHEAKHIRDATRRLNPDFIVKVPGIRPSGSALGDQSRVMTPAEALDRGATYLVIGRPITEADCPRTATRGILSEMSRHLRR